ncbi:MAG: hypothetical protein WCX31_04600 [Salinivirgaceae bacterium]|jgi:hypothetical protein
MANQKLKSWLQSPERDYNAGVTLFKELKVNPKKEGFFNTEEPEAIHRNMLYSLLANYHRVYNQDEKQPEKEEASNKKQSTSKNLQEVKEKLGEVEKEIATGRVVIDKNPRVKYEDLSDELKKAYDENGENYSKVKTLHAKIKAVPADVTNDEERKELLNEMLSIQENIKANWKLIDDWAAGLPPVTGVQPTKPSGALTKAEIDATTDLVIQAQSKDLRIKANVAYLRRFSKDENKAKEVELRISELKAWEVNYEESIGNTPAAGAGK